MKNEKRGDTGKGREGKGKDMERKPGEERVSEGRCERDQMRDIGSGGKRCKTAER